MKVLYQNNLPSPYIVDFFNLLGKECELTVLYERHTASDRDAKWTGDLAKSYKEIYLHGKKIGTDNSFCPSIIKYLKGDFDYIIIGDYGTYTAMWAIHYMRRHKIPYIISTDGGFANFEESRIKKMLKTYLISGASKWLSSGGLTDEYLKYYGASHKKIVRYPFTSLSADEILKKPLKNQEKNELRNKLDLKGDIVIIGVGQLIKRKGWDILADAMRKMQREYSNEVKNIHIYIVGGEEDKLVELIGALPENMHVIPFMPKRNLFEYYKASDIFVLPTREDIWGLVINEAMACGLPVITTDRCNAGIELIENDVNGYVVHVEDTKLLSEALYSIANNGELRANMSINNLEKISTYTYQNMVDVYMSIM